MFASSVANSVPPPQGSADESTSLLVDALRYASSTKLMESLLHDVRNPLNALAINAEVLTEKLKGPDGQVPPAQEKNLKAIREQVQRVDSVLRQFAQFLVPTRASASSECALSELVQRALEVVGHESRRGRVKVRMQLAPDLRVKVADLDGLHFLVFRGLMRGIERSAAGTELAVLLSELEGGAILTIRDPGNPSPPEGPLERGLQEMARRAGGHLLLRDGELSISLPLV